MLRIRLFKILLPLLFIGVVALLVWAMQPPIKGPVLPPGTEIKREVQGGTILQYSLDEGGALIEILNLVADRTEECPGELCYEFFGVERFKLHRENEGPLEISAVSTRVTGPEGERKMHFVGPVEVVDHDLGLVLDLPHLEVDELAGVARSSGALFIEGANHHTRSERLIYGLAGQPSELTSLECEDDEGGVLRAERAFLHDGLHDMELVQGVRFRRGDDESFRAETSRVVRDEDGKLRQVTASGNVVVSFRAKDAFIEAAGDTIEARWNDSAEVSELLIEGRALIEQGARMVSADRLAFRATPEGGWAVDARDTVRLAMPTDQGPVHVRAETLEGTLDAALDLLAAEAHGGVQFEATQTRADAAEARLFRGGDLDSEIQIELLSEGDQRAHLAQARSRVTADRIVTDSGGRSLQATGRVESTLLPQDDSNALDGLFRTDKAVHFISTELAGDKQGQRLTFRGNARGWQGEQNLSAQEITLDQEDGSVQARERVTTRFPRQRDGTAARADEFIQISAAELDYRESDYRAVYRDQVRVVLAEGWIESETLTVLQIPGESGFEQLLAAGSVRLEFIGDESEGTSSRTLGRADRLDYLPAKETLTLYGDEQRAEIQRAGEQAGTSRGKVLTYRLSDGTLTVEGSTISTPPPAAKRPSVVAEKQELQETPE